jgi:hypothetical protein
LVFKTPVLTCAAFGSLDGYLVTDHNSSNTFGVVMLMLLSVLVFDRIKREVRFTGSQLNHAGAASNICEQYCKMCSTGVFCVIHT